MVMPSFTKKYYHAPYPAIDPNRPELSADGKVVVITGGGSGIGQASALAFAKAHAKVVVILGRRINALQETKHLVQRLDGGTTIATYSVDITDEQAVADCFRDITFRYGRIDVCIHAAAYLANKGTIKDTKLSEFWASFDIGVKGTFIVTQQFLHYCSEHSPLLVAVNSLISHLAAVHVDSAPASYAASKIAVAKMVEYTAAENPHVRCYSLHPGVIDTDMSRKSIAMMPEDKRESQPFLPFDDVSLPACFAVWLASGEGAVIPSGRYLWSNWDVEELKERADKIKEDPFALILTLPGWPWAFPAEEVAPDYKEAAKLARSP